MLRVALWFPLVFMLCMVFKDFQRNTIGVILDDLYDVLSVHFLCVFSFFVQTLWRPSVLLMDIRKPKGLPVSSGCSFGQIVRSFHWIPFLDVHVSTPSIPIGVRRQKPTNHAGLRRVFVRSTKFFPNIGVDYSERSNHTFSSSIILSEATMRYIDSPLRILPRNMNCTISLIAYSFMSILML